jgi:hypothetical protein
VCPARAPHATGQPAMVPSAVARPAMGQPRQLQPSRSANRGRGVPENGLTYPGGTYAC